MDSAGTHFTRIIGMAALAIALLLYVWGWMIDTSVDASDPAVTAEAIRASTSSFVRQQFILWLGDRLFLAGLVLTATGFVVEWTARRGPDG